MRAPIPTTDMQRVQHVANRDRWKRLIDSGWERVRLTKAARLERLFDRNVSHNWTSASTQMSRGFHHRNTSRWDGEALMMASFLCFFVLCSLFFILRFLVLVRYLFLVHSLLHAASLARILFQSCNPAAWHTPPPFTSIPDPKMEVKPLPNSLVVDSSGLLYLFGLTVEH